MKRLSVMYCGWGERWRLGTLADDGAALLFEYSSDAIRRGLELSPWRLLLRERAYGDFPSHQQRLPGLISDALPDGWGMLLMDRLFRKNGRDPLRVSPLERLAFIGDRALGALAFEPADADLLEPADIQLLTLGREIRQVIRGAGSAALRDLALMGGSPHGARPKVVLHYDAATGHFGNDATSAGVPWLIKFQAPHEHKEVCAIEALYGDLARACGLDMPDSAYFDIDRTTAAFGVARFDRQNGQRIPMHTLAGALHADFRLPGAVDYLTFLRMTRLMCRSEREVVKGFERCVFNVMFNNRDDHAKNFCWLLGHDGQWRLSPAYDLTWNPGPGGEHQMDICGESRAPGRADLLRLAARADIKARQADEIMDRIALTAGTLKAQASRFAIRKQTVASLLKSIEANRARMRGLSGRG